MDIPLNELLAALPDDSAEPTPELPREELERIFADLAMRRPPTTSLHRAWTLGELSAQVALAYGTRTVRGWFANESDRARNEAESNLRIALKIFHRLGYLRGLLMKAGQLIGSLPNIAPAQITEMLDHLHFNAPPMHFSLIREVIENELGAPPETLFAEFDKTAFAAASIGQVHRATLKSGEPVAVKIQYPGISRTIDSDMRAISTLLAPLAIGGHDYLGPKLDELRRMLKQETDYELEAEALRLARSLFAEHHEIVVPRVHERYSGARVLAMDFIPGQHLNAFLATNPAQETRDAYGKTICFAWRRMHAAKLNYADPHPGNYIFMPDGRLGLIDFGCMQRFTDAEFEALRWTFQCHNPGAIRQRLIDCGRPESEYDDEAFIRIVAEGNAWLTQTVTSPQPFDYGDPANLTRRIEVVRSLANNKAAIKGNPMFLYLDRADFALTALLYRLRARVDMRTLPIPEWWN
jgi:hypothetical protein